MMCKGCCESDSGNFLFIYGCPPGNGVVRNSKLLQTIEQQLLAHTFENVFILPDALNFIRKRDSKIEIVNACL